MQMTHDCEYMHVCHLQTNVRIHVSPSASMGQAKAVCHHHTSSVIGLGLNDYHGSVGQHTA